MSGAEVGSGEGWASTVSETASQARTAQASPGVAWDAKQLSEREEKLIAPRVVVRDLVGHDDAEQGFERESMGAEVVCVGTSEVAAAAALRVDDRAPSTAKRKQIGSGDWIARKTVGPKRKRVRVETETAGEVGLKRCWVEDDAEPGKRMRDSGRWEPAADAEPPD